MSSPRSKPNSFLLDEINASILIIKNAKERIPVRMMDTTKEDNSLNYFVFVLGFFFSTPINIMLMLAVFIKLMNDFHKDLSIPDTNLFNLHSIDTNLNCVELERINYLNKRLNLSINNMTMNVLDEALNKKRVAIEKKFPFFKSADRAKLPNEVINTIFTMFDGLPDKLSCRKT
jgi:hypothetical protein